MSKNTFTEQQLAKTLSQVKWQAITLPHAKQVLITTAQAWLNVQSSQQTRCCLQHG